LTGAASNCSTRSAVGGIAGGAQTARQGPGRRFSALHRPTLRLELHGRCCCRPKCRVAHVSSPVDCMAALLPSCRQPEPTKWHKLPDATEVPPICYWQSMCTIVTCRAMQEMLGSSRRSTACPAHAQKP
jgi:hypothetical protein